MQVRFRVGACDGAACSAAAALLIYGFTRRLCVQCCVCVQCGVVRCVRQRGLHGRASPGWCWALVSGCACRAHLGEDIIQKGAPTRHTHASMAGGAGGPAGAGDERDDWRDSSEVDQVGRLSTVGILCRESYLKCE